MVLAHCKNIRRFYSKIAGNHFQYFLQAPVNIFRNQAQYGSTEYVLFFGHIALQPYNGVIECCRLTLPYHILISKMFYKRTPVKITASDWQPDARYFTVISTDFLQCTL